MSITFACSCGKPLKARDEYGGRKIRCPGCRRVLVVPSPSAAEEISPEAIAVEGAAADDMAEANAESSPTSPVLAEDPLAAPLADADLVDIPELDVEILDNSVGSSRNGSTDEFPESPMSPWIDRSLEQTITPWRPGDQQNFNPAPPGVPWLWLVLVTASILIMVGTMVAVALTLFLT